MKKLLLAGVGVLALTFAAPATAADLPARMPAKAPVYVAPVFSWTGFYVGGHLGWARIDLDSATLGSGSDDGFIYGGQVGFNYQINQFVIGVEGQLSGADIGSAATVGVAPGLVATASAGVDWMATLALRFGVAFGNSLLYAKVGAAWMDFGWNAAVSTTPGGVVLATAGGGATETGWMLGAGFEYAFTPNWSAKIEYNYLDFGGATRTVTGTFLGAPFAFTDNVDLTTHLVKVGINYRFGPF
jgi:outer membrane immunogenic protein